MENTKNSNALSVLINSINAQIKELDNSGYFIRDEENPSYKIQNIYYDPKENELFFRCAEELKNE